MSRPARLTPRATTALVAVAALVATTTWVLATAGHVPPDTRLHDWLLANPNSAVHALGTGLKQPGTRTTYLVTVGIVGVVGSLLRRSPKPLLMIAALVVVETGALFVGKVVVGRRAPRSGLVATHTAGASFPAGHAANALLAAGLAGWYLADLLRRPELRARLSASLASVVGGTTGAAMTWLDYHWLTDTVAGWSIGTLFLLAGTALDGRIEHPRRHGPADRPDGLPVQRQMAAPRRSSPDRS